VQNDTVVNIDTVKDCYNKLVKYYSQIEEIQLDIKAVKEELKAEGVNPSNVAKYAKAFVKHKKDEVKEQAESLVEVGELLAS
jgi:hypothetical protein